LTLEKRKKDIARHNLSPLEWGGGRGWGRKNADNVRLPAGEQRERKKKRKKEKGAVSPAVL